MKVKYKILCSDFVFRFCVQILCSDFVFRFCVQILCWFFVLDFVLVFCVQIFVLVFCVGERFRKCAGTPKYITTPIPKALVFHHFSIKQTGFQCHISQPGHENNALIYTMIYLVSFKL